MSLSLVRAAKQLGNDIDIMDSYWKYHEREQNWFFSPNPYLDNAESKPKSFPSSNTWKELSPKEKKVKWERLSLRQRMTLTTLAGFGYEGKGINLDNINHFSKLREGYNKWRSDLHSVFWSDDGLAKRWLCNVFVGDAIYLSGSGNSLVAHNNHYYDPSQIYMGKSSLRKRSSYKDAKAGDIVVFGTHHVEIITEIQKNWIADDGFCSIGAGRTDSYKENDGDGREKCDSFFSIGTRELNNKENSYFYL
ncbi:hypothetical protein SL053_000479 [Flavobacterium psychrophilum]|nr:hypothetical protein [Flavobacterium psychrophilum]